VLDPPRQGALKQSEAIANSKCQTIIYVSCNPASFARDCSIIEQKNYTLKTIQPIDQFKWSHHIELVAVFEKNK
jgi:23S rRNA (uracil1939-C5)-methyltransferase